MAAAPAVPGNAGRADYPKMLFLRDGRTMVVETPEEHDTMAQEGWEQIPGAIHTTPNPTFYGMSAGDPLAQLIRETLEAVLDERGIGKRRIK
jgi:hypothetical protein